ncbi:TMEM175 family protein [Actinacidiphila rubida]|uniref:DUF1211 domain-containing protein n=1 Tax=Actinacidiphila rubida TaxID=310780 RepID=A0A1H8JCW2_9ACTN|nr:TMEM175 family protein [Actinacidiphila rubida]SEN78622.1 Protein of unknown function [Actinacidiphila rubida]
MRLHHGIDVERMRAFADAVFSIAITLLALDMTVPEGLPAGELGHALRAALPEVAGYALSFVVVGALWLSHHRLFGMVKELDHVLLRAGLALLGIVAALPFPTRVISAYGGNALATSFYAATIALAASLIAFMFHLLRVRPGLRRDEVPRSSVTHAVRLSCAVAAVFATSVPLALVSPNLSEYWWILVVPVRQWFSRRPAGVAGAVS